MLSCNEQLSSSTILELLSLNYVELSSSNYVELLSSINEELPSSSNVDLSSPTNVELLSSTNVVVPSPDIDDLYPGLTFMLTMLAFSGGFLSLENLVLVQTAGGQPG